MMAANLPLAFGSLLAGGLLLEHGLAATKTAFTRGATPGAISTVANKNLGPTTNPIPGATGGRLDQGLDGTASRFLAPFGGRVVKAARSDPGWNGGGYVAIASASDPNTVYYAAEGLAPVVSEGQQVNAGDLIAVPAVNPYNGILGSFEIGRANPASPGQPLAQIISDPAGMVIEFYRWLRSLGGPAASSVTGAGHG